VAEQQAAIKRAKQAEWIVKQKADAEKQAAEEEAIKRKLSSR
jgi:hypothetical protein